MAESSKIYEFIAQQGGRSSLPGPWQAHACHEAFVDVSAALPTLRQHLQETFADEDLLQAGVLVPDDDEPELQLAPELAAGSGRVLCLKAEAQGPPFDLFADGQLLSRSRAGWNAVLDDYSIRQMINGGKGDLFVTLALADLAVLWSLDLPAIPAAGLECLAGQELATFFERLGRPIDASASERQNLEEQLERRTLSLTLVNWPLGQLVLADQAACKRILQHFWKLEKHLDVCLDEFGVWKPSPQNLERLNFTIGMGNVKLSRQALLKNLDEDCGTMRAPPAAPRASESKLPRSYVEAVQHWLSLGRQDARTFSSHDLDRQRDWEQLIKLQERELIQPLLAELTNMAAPSEINLMVGFAGLCRLTHPALLRLASQMNSLSNGAGPMAERMLNELQSGLALVDRLRAVAQEVRAWRTKIPPATLTQPNAPPSSSSSSASRPKKSPK